MAIPCLVALPVNGTSATLLASNTVGAATDPLTVQLTQVDATGPNGVFILGMNSLTAGFRYSRRRQCCNLCECGQPAGGHRDRPGAA